jgi:hypothetical protein
MVFCSSLMPEKSSNHLSSTRDLKISLAFVMNKTPYSHFLLIVFTHYGNQGPGSFPLPNGVYNFIVNLIIDKIIDNVPLRTPLPKWE